MKDLVMKSAAPIKLPKDDIIHKIASVVTFSGPIRRMGLWLERKLKIDLYEWKAAKLFPPDTESNVLKCRT